MTMAAYPRSGRADEDIPSSSGGESYGYSYTAHSTPLPYRDLSLHFLPSPVHPSSSSSSSSPSSLPSPSSHSPHPLSPITSAAFDTSFPSTPSPLPSSPAPSETTILQSPESGGLEQKRKRKSMLVRISSCNFCHRSKVKCTGDSFPCLRCVENERSHLCKEWKSQARVHSLIKEPSRVQSRHTKKGKGEGTTVWLTTSSPSPSSSEPPVFHILPHTPTHPLAVFSPLPPSAPFSQSVSRSLLRAVISYQQTHGYSLPSLDIHFLCIRFQSQLVEEDFQTLVHFTSPSARLARGEIALEEKEELEDEEQSKQLRLFYAPPAPPSFHRSMDVSHSPTRLSYYSFSASPLQPLRDLEYNNHATLMYGLTPDSVGDFLITPVNGVRGMTPPPGRPLTASFTVVVNQAFERLFGYSQSEIRWMFMKYEWKAPFVLVERNDWESSSYRDISQLRPHNAHSGLIEERGWEERVTCVDKWGRLFDCMMARSFVMGDNSRCIGMHTMFLSPRKHHPLGNL